MFSMGFRRVSAHLKKRPKQAKKEKIQREESCRPSDAPVTLNSYRSAFLRRSAFMITETELKVIAALAIMGLSSSPKYG